MDPEFLRVEDFVKTAKEMSELLKKKGCNYIIALTHLRMPNDRILAEKCQDDINLILGGHDHDPFEERIGKITIIKSGTNFEEFSDLTIDLTTNQVKRKQVLITD